MIVRAILEHARKRDWIEVNPAAESTAFRSATSGDYDFVDREELDALVAAAASEQDAAIYRQSSRANRRLPRERPQRSL